MVKGIVLFDGVCNLCNGLVQFILKRDQRDHFRFASLQGETGQQLLKEKRISTDLDSFIYISDKRVYTKSSAALQVVKHLPGLWKGLYIFVVIPKFIRDWLYAFVATNRYKWFGKQDYCMMPKPEYKQKFLD
ncbi:thiol-disulfide oxidoreductase DCC family protein [Tenuibacillus multivorans]|uniref:Predicted thiol-disulfide oxidoreductase YuxK, DCC family n=1 Tax=Tenuibacillus multivorans TaxID=237069 RepID=A0A1G9YGX7_9BACI|nr:thiol-disulfide oxidoreductase DCC family protein [Tenuibacillus multivorans]GEL78539.1 hypothetical protein TMU01_27740 [Tenuibacillus multivorans]SDN07733.1 Predicted thiol-disulfide oxidoreductase YuxK, DCC family [Tenuibacillus multivorans]